jgi:hypothetical protein
VAASYDIVGQYPDVIVLGTGKTQDVQVIQVQTKPHGVYFETSLSRQNATTANIKNQVAGFSLIYEMLFDIAGVADVQWTQEPTAAGQLEDHVIVYVESTSGDSTAQLDFPYAQFNQDVIEPRVASLRSSLDATEAA